MTALNLRRMINLGLQLLQKALTQGSPMPSQPASPMSPDPAGPSPQPTPAPVSPSPAPAPLYKHPLLHNLLQQAVPLLLQAVPLLMHGA